MVKMNISYEGDLRCRLVHEPSGNEILTDAPVDNMGKGAAFSPTDLTAASLGACMLTIMGIAAQRHNIDLKGVKVEVEKEMVASPVRRIGTISVTFRMPRGIDPAMRSTLQRAAETCPVHKSLHPDINLPIKFEYPD